MCSRSRSRPMSPTKARGAIALCPLQPCCRPSRPHPHSTLETAALDGFAAQIPLALATQTEPSTARAWLAIEPAGAPWPPLPGKTASAGPFYVVWEHPEASRISSEYWAYQVAALRYVPGPATRWPQITVDPALPARCARGRRSQG